MKVILFRLGFIYINLSPASSEFENELQKAVSESDSDVIEGFLRSRANDNASFTYSPPSEGFTTKMPKPNFSSEGKGWTGDLWNGIQYVGFVYLLSKEDKLQHQATVKFVLENSAIILRYYLITSNQLLAYM